MHFITFYLVFIVTFRLGQTHFLTCGQYAASHGMALECRTEDSMIIAYEHICGCL
jgi:hypothetical protein